MGRSVYTPSGAQVVANIDVSDFEESFEWDDLLENLSAELKAKYPSLDVCEDWIDDEGCVFLNNRIARVGISEYCGLAAVWVLPVEESYYSDNSRLVELGTQWCNQIARGFLKVVGDVAGPVYKKVGSFSNGEGVYAKVEV